MVSDTHLFPYSLYRVTACPGIHELKPAGAEEDADEGEGSDVSDHPKMVREKRTSKNGVMRTQTDFLPILAMLAPS